MPGVLNAIGIGFDANKAKPNLKMSMQRLQVRCTVCAAESACTCSCRSTCCRTALVALLLHTCCSLKASYLISSQVRLLRMQSLP
jgi:hypothetical protein